MTDVLLPVARTAAPATPVEVRETSQPTTPVALEPANAFHGTTAEDLAVAVAPSTGRFQPVDGAVGRWFEAGALVGHVTGGKGRADAVRAPLAAQVADLLVRPGQLVHRGQALVWLRRPVERRADVA